MKTKTEPFEVLIPTPDGKQVAERVPIEVVHEWDEEIGEWLLSPESLKLIEDTKARHMGLLLPEELQALRERLDMTQSEIANLLEIGEKSWSRWESGRHRPSRSMNLLIKALDKGRLDVPFLAGATQFTPQWSFINTCRGTHKAGMVVPRTPGCAYDQYAPKYSEDEIEAESQFKVLAA